MGGTKDREARCNWYDLGEGMGSPHTQIIKKYPREIAHLRTQTQDGRKHLGILFGAGVSGSYELPSWVSLVGEIQKNLEAQGVTLGSIAGGVTYQTQILYQHFRNHFYSSGHGLKGALLDAEFRKQWRTIVHGALYKNFSGKTDADLKKHPYLEAWVPLIKTISLLINYNFDDCVERLLTSTRTAEDKSRTMGFEAIWQPRYRFSPERTAIYHPNGFLPWNMRDKHSDQLVFSEDSFADQIIEAASGRFPFMVDYLVRHTCILLGFSLDDTTLKSLLRQHARVNPGHYHYYIRYMNTPDELSDEQRQAIQDANFNVYNLITLFLGTEEIKSLGELLVMSEENFVSCYHAAGAREKYKYYFVGPVASGKTSNISQFRSLIVLDEWLDSRIDEIMKPSIDLTTEESTRVDGWIFEQVRKKNVRMQKFSFGLIAMDRAPLDAFAFTEEGKWKEKATAIRENVCGTGSSARQLEAGHVILLSADPADLESRTRARGRSGDAAYLTRQQDDLHLVYNKEKYSGVSVVNTKGQSIAEIAQRIAQIVFREEYIEFPMHGRMLEIERSGRPQDA
jgi:hypothetical protein